MIGSTIPDESSRPARIVKNAFSATFLFVLAQANWSFAIRTVELAARAPDPDWPIALGRTAFPLPADMARFVEIVDPELDDQDGSYSIEGGPGGTELLCEETGPITVRYVRTGADLEDPVKWPANFVEAFTWRLAWQIAEPLAADKGRKDRAFKAFDEAIRAAKRANNRMKGRKGDFVTPWSAARRCSTVRAPGT
jgi:hypothetical protein